MDQIADFARILSVWLLPVLLAITLHEAAHAWTAEKLGDDTARRLGRVSFNPVRHVDPFGTFLLPGLLVLAGAPFVFGWAKPVPVAFHRLRRPKTDMIWVALAGPGINIAMAVIAATAMHFTDLPPDWLGPWLHENLQNAVLVNLVLAAFNMLPLPPLDGGRVLVGVLPGPLAVRVARLERYGLLILIAAVFLLPMLAAQLGYQINPLAALLLPMVQFLYDVVLLLSFWGAG
ncbi:site-2 protease family protein [Geminicoccaceae bacterium 1502E]|nr:site-2 protease family protein [Geminicoccaceae bacterium 1502E]